MFYSIRIAIILSTVCVACGGATRPTENVPAVPLAHTANLHLIGNISYQPGKETEAVDAYVARGYSVSSIDAEGLSPLMRCAQNDFADLAAAFLAQGASINDTSPGIEVIEGNVILSFDTGPVPNPRAGQKSKSDVYRGWTALMIAVDKGHYHTAELLIRHGASFETRGFRNETPLSIARFRGDTSIIDLLTKPASKS